MSTMYWTRRLRWHSFKLVVLTSLVWVIFGFCVLVYYLDCLSSSGINCSQNGISVKYTGDGKLNILLSFHFIFTMTIYTIKSLKKTIDLRFMISCFCRCCRCCCRCCRLYNFRMICCCCCFSNFYTIKLLID